MREVPLQLYSTFFCVSVEHNYCSRQPSTKDIQEIRVGNILSNGRVWKLNNQSNSQKLYS